MAWATASIKQGCSVDLADVDDLIQLRADLDSAPVRPLIVTLASSVCHVELGIVGDQGFVQGASPDRQPPYRVTLGDEMAGGVVAFYLHGEHRSEIPVRYLVPIEDAWAAAAELLSAGTYASTIKWDEA